MDSDFERNPDDEREVDLSDGTEEPSPPPTLDPEERVEVEDDDDAPLDEDRPA